MIRSMVRLSAWGIRSRSQEIIGAFYDLGVLHPDLGELPEERAPARLNEIRILRGRILGLIEALGWNEWECLREKDLAGTRDLFSSLGDEDIIPEIDRSLDTFSLRLASLTEEKTRNDDELSKLAKAMDVLSHFAPFLRKDRGDKDRVSSLWWTEERQVAEILAQVHRLMLSQASPDDRFPEHHFLAGKNGALGILALRFPPEVREGTEAILFTLKALPWRPPSCCEKLDEYSWISRIGREIETLSSRNEKISQDLSQASAEWGSRLACLYLLMDEKTEQMAVELRCSSSREFFSLHGWIPADVLPQAEESLRARFGSDILLQWRLPESEEWEIVPTALKNRPAFSPFEIFLKLMQPPAYAGFDPTAALAVFFPFFSGCMVGDVGYGIILAILALGLWKKSARPALRDGGLILLYVAAWSILWGILWGEFFGDAGHRLFHMRPLWTERSEGVLPVLVFSVALGAAHVFLGLLLGIYQGLKYSRRHLWMEKAGNLIVLLGLIGCIVLLKSRLPAGFFTIPVSFLAVGLALLVAGGGIGGIIEAIGSIGNIISYVRIAAIGLSSAILALVASKFVDVLGISVLGLFLALVIHLLNFVLAIGGSGLHSARLHYVEFFGKFYSGGGKNYTPFRRRSGSSWKKHS